jgi:large subunit ribosomal protein L2
MPVKTYRPYTPSRRTITTPDFSELTKTAPHKALLAGKRKKSGRNNTGMVMVRHQGGGHKQHLRLIDFKREKDGIPAKVASIEYDPGRTARISLLNYADGEKRYVLHAVGMQVGDMLMSGKDAEIKVGNCLPLASIPEGTFVHCIELTPGRGAQMVRSAGGQAQLMAKEGPYAQVKMPSGEVRLVPRDAKAVIGQVGNVEHDTISLGNAGRSRHLGIRPTVRGGAMNPVDHPMGGGRGKSKGNNQPRSPWNQPSKGYKTRTKKKIWGWMIVQDRRIAKKGTLG